jgi:RNA polymerase subunit RPABC4/transcription elongation factor Spt4
MRICRTCRLLTAGNPTFCPSCGGTYDAKLCPNLHVNARSSSVCSVCGSRDLSSPQPRRRAVLLIALAAIRAIIPVILLAVTVLYFVGFTIVALRDADRLLGPMLFGLGLGCLWLLYVTMTGRSNRAR